MPVHSTTVDGITMRWEEDGVVGADGQVPVVFLRGIPTSPRLWRHVLPLVGGRRLVWEMVGYGESIPEGSGRDLSLTWQTDYLMAWLRAVDAWPAVLATTWAAAWPRSSLCGSSPPAPGWCWSTASATTPYGQRLAHDLDAPLVTLDRARHFVPEDRPDAVAAAVEEVAAEARSVP